MPLHEFTDEERKKGQFGVTLDPREMQRRGVEKRMRNKLMSESAKEFLLQTIDEKGTTRQDDGIWKAIKNVMKGVPTLDDLLKIQKLVGEEKTTVENDVKMQDFDILRK